MLGLIRDKASGWIAGIIVGALVLSFAFWGVSSYFGQGGDVNVATVNDSQIKLKSFQQSFYSLRKQMQSMLQDDALTLEEEAFVKEETLKRLIETEVVNQLIKDNGLRITNTKVVETIKELEYFKNDEVFDRDKYERKIISMGMEPAYFEAQMRMDLLSEQLQAGLSESLFVLEFELNNVVRLKSQTRDLTYSILSLTSFIEEGVIKDSEIDVFYKANPHRFIEPEKVKIEYLELNVNVLAESIISHKESLKNYYNNNKNKYDVVEQRSITKLFVKADAESTAEDKDKAKEVINSAISLIKKGKNFEEVIEKFTEEGKGSLEFSEHAYMAKGVMDKELDEFLFGSDEGAVSDLIETESGFNIVKVGEIRGGPKNVYETVADQVKKDYKNSEAKLQFFELSDQLTNLTYEHSDTLEFAADAVGGVFLPTAKANTHLAILITGDMDAANAITFNTSGSACIGEDSNDAVFAKQVIGPEMGDASATAQTVTTVGVMGSGNGTDSALSNRLIYTPAAAATNFLQAGSMMHFYCPVDNQWLVKIWNIKEGSGATGTFTVGA